MNSRTIRNLVSKEGDLRGVLSKDRGQKVMIPKTVHRPPQTYTKVPMYLHINTQVHTHTHTHRHSHIKILVEHGDTSKAERIERFEGNLRSASFT